MALYSQGGNFPFVYQGFVNSAWHIISAQSMVAINVTSYYHREFQMQITTMILTNVC